MTKFEIMDNFEKKFRVYTKPEILEVLNKKIGNSTGKDKEILQLVKKHCRIEFPNRVNNKNLK